MDRQELHRLGRRLVELSRHVDLHSGDVRPSPAAELVLADVMFHPGSTVTEVVQRTGFTQSYVSRLVAELVEQGALSTRADTADRRRTIVEPTAKLSTAARRRTASLDEVLVSALGDPERARSVMATLDQLAAQLRD
ncbi:MarR family winged helix-turn-helix transcriptional regulator [Mycolicibacterium sp. P9-22]|uniref:MarR family winged helix-turn-helix transcriptional regulator n=1 Tax=Mycolicibacterium sp. P9-22 TaxID=2024613 RepID=UPI0018847FA8|nr:helix-turn-helix domain-containing protein [Mycolicibacterium sp. P9-22]